MIKDFINKVFCGDVVQLLKKLPNNSIDCCITSPPYWQLRDYGWNGQWGLEGTFEEYLFNLWLFMDILKLKLKDTGTAWINLGDTFNGSKQGNTNGTYGGVKQKKGVNDQTINKPKQSVPDKCLLLIPHRFAIGSIDRGWILRNDIIWHKTNGMPESATDRLSKKHEHIFLFVKNKKYYFDLDAIRIPHEYALNDKRSRVKGGVKTNTLKTSTGDYGIDKSMLQ